ncbi:MAG: hypothetical protein ABSH45_10120 [Bryobacteraceae bacterium]|jgi:hypothetical protein
MQPFISNSPHRLAAALVLGAALLSPGCKRDQKVQVQPTIEEEDTPRLASAVPMNVPKLAPQLVSGFYPIENNSWRWTGKQFSVLLRPPTAAAQRGAVLSLEFSVPDPVIQTLHAVTLKASVEGTALPPETYTKSGAYTFKREIPASAISGESVRIDFALDKAMPPAGAERRELGVVAVSVSLGPK